MFNKPDGAVTKEYLISIFDYKDGNLYWKEKVSDKVVIGSKVGSLKHGRPSTKINKKDYYLHRLIFCMHYGYFPEMVDHIDGNILNNKIENLRGCNKFENARNSKRPITNTTGVKGVQWKKDKNKFKVEIWVDKKPRFFGYYDSLDEAKLIAISARNKHHKEFARHE